MKSDTSLKKKCNTNRRRHVSNECLLDNIVDEDLQAVIFPLTLFSSIFLMSRFSIINSFITPDYNASFYFKSVLGLIILLMANIFRYIIITLAIDSSATSLVMLVLNFDLIFYCSLAIIIYIVNASQRNNVVALIIKLQRVLNLTKIEKKTFLFKHKIYNWISVLFFVITFVCFSICAVGGITFIDILRGFMVTGPLIIYDTEILTVTCAVVFIKNELVAWINIMDAYNNSSIKTEAELKDNENFQSNMFEAYVDIVKAFELCNKIYQFSFTYIGFQTFIHSIISLQFVLELEKLSSASNVYGKSMTRLLSALWNIRNIILLATLSIASEQFYCHIKLAESSCARILGDDQATDMRATCKNVLRLNRAALRKLSAFGMFEIDAAFPLRLLGGLVAYTVILLQFALKL